MPSPFSLSKERAMSAQAANITGTHETLRTERLLLRRPRMDDADAITELADNWNVVRNLAVLPYPYRREHAVQWISETQSRLADGSTVFAVCLDDDPQTLIGVCGCGAPLGGRAGRLGYWFGEPWWGRGYATEAVGALVRHMFERFGDLETLHSECHQDNPASRNVLEKCGFKVTGESMEHCLARGEHVPGFKLVLVRDEWERRTVSDRRVSP
jgi:RimJ/RimL family protein N-acetyltransferase